MASMDSVRKKIIEKQQRQKAAGIKGYWQMKTTIREDLYPIVLNEGDRTNTNSPSEVANRALQLMQRLMDATGSKTFTEAAEKIIYAGFGNHYPKDYPLPTPRPASPPVQMDTPDAASQFEQLMNS